MYTLDILLKHYGWQGGTIHEAKDHFKTLTLDEMDKIFNDLMANMLNLKDLYNMLELSKIRTSYLQIERQIK